MQVHLTLEQEAHPSQIADANGTDPERLVKEATMRLLQEDLHFREGVQRGIAAADRGELLESPEVWNKIESILQA